MMAIHSIKYAFKGRGEPFVLDPDAVSYKVSTGDKLIWNSSHTHTHADADVG